MGCAPWAGGCVRCPYIHPSKASPAGMEARMARRCKEDPRFSLEVGFEPRRGGQDALTGAYRRLLPPLSCPVRLTPRARMGEEASDAAANDSLDATAARDAGPGGDLRQGVLRPTG